MKKRGALSDSRRRATQRRMLAPRQLWAARVLVGWNRKDLARHSKTSPDTVQAFENRGSDPKQSTILAWERALRKAGVVFIDGDDNAGPGVRLREPQR
jgi:ribosome-binding protein aMBF1 (putative translation factor)